MISEQIYNLILCCYSNIFSDGNRYAFPLGEGRREEFAIEMLKLMYEQKKKDDD